MTYSLIMYGHCGMSTPVDSGELAECRIAAARYLKRRIKRGYQVSVIKSGLEYETIPPDSYYLVPDDAGLLCIKPNPAIKSCKWCGSEFQPEDQGQSFCDESCSESYYG